jgi:hypothetical protein
MEDQSLLSSLQHKVCASCPSFSSKVIMACNATETRLTSCPPPRHRLHQHFISRHAAMNEKPQGFHSSFTIFELGSANEVND